MDAERLETPWGILWVPRYSHALIRKVRAHGGFELFKLRHFFLWSRIFYGEDHRGLFVDVGANVGTTSIPAAHSPRVTSVLSLEPVPALADLLARGVKDSGLEDRVEVLNVAAGDRAGVAQMALNPVNCGDNRLGHAPADWKGQTVNVVRLDDLDIDPAFLWIDAQGWETKILQGATRFLGRPTFLELWPSGLQDPEGLFQILEGSWSHLIDIRGRGVRPIQDAQTIFEILRPRGPGAHTDLFLIRR